MKIDEIIKSMEGKLDETNKGLIADDLANLIQFDYDNTAKIKDLNNKVTTIENEKEKLLAVNGNLLQKIPMGREEEKEPETEERKPFNFKSIFDEKGNIKR